MLSKHGSTKKGGRFGLSAHAPQALRSGACVTLQLHIQQLILFLLRDRQAD
eukprot:COSAG06_NODE_32773_length_500_cov_1.341646_1_plen_50_part_10